MSDRHPLLNGFTVKSGKTYVAIRRLWTSDPTISEDGKSVLAVQMRDGKSYGALRWIKLESVQTQLTETTER